MFKDFHLCWTDIVNHECFRTLICTGQMKASLWVLRLSIKFLIGTFMTGTFCCYMNILWSGFLKKRSRFSCILTPKLDILVTPFWISNLLDSAGKNYYFMGTSRRFSSSRRKNCLKFWNKSKMRICCLNLVSCKFYVSLNLKFPERGWSSKHFVNSMLVSRQYRNFPSRKS